MISMIRFWNEEYENHMLNEGYEKVWCSWDQNGNWLLEKTTMVRPTLSLDELRVIYL